MGQFWRKKTAGGLDALSEPFASSILNSCGAGAGARRRPPRGIIPRTPESAGGAAVGFKSTLSGGQYHSPGTSLIRAERRAVPTVRTYKR